MSEEQEIKNEKNNEGYTTMSNQEKSIRNVLVVAAIALALGLFGAGFGVYSAIQVNRVLDSFERNDLTLGDGDEVEYDDADEEDDISIEDDEFKFGLPANADSIDYISLMYNSGDNYLEVYKDDSTIEYSVLDESDEYQTDSVNGDVSRIFKYVYENNLDKLKASEIAVEDETWYLEVGSNEGYSYAGGKGSLPEWVNALIEEVKASEKE